ncbi:MAG: hypothetical protein Q4F55_03325 [Bacillota bacterium]|nr:hypothetical protein [Bacillota bacterium]
MEPLRKSTATFSKASLFVEAAITLPIFILALVMLLQFMITIGKEETAYYEAETRIETIGTFGGKLELGFTVDNPNKQVYIEHVQTYPIIINNSYLKSFSLVMDMPYKTYIEESPDKYKNSELVYIFPKNEGKEKEGPRYHTCYCSTIKGGHTKGLEIIQVTKAEAERRGYTLCKHCTMKQKKLSSMN